MKTLEQICNEIYSNRHFDSLPVMYRLQVNGGDLLFGYCTVNHKMSGFDIESDDGDDYYLSDSIVKSEYNPEYFDGLVVWINAEFE